MTTATVASLMAKTSCVAQKTILRYFEHLDQVSNVLRLACASFGCGKSYALQENSVDTLTGIVNSGKESKVFKYDRHRKGLTATVLPTKRKRLGKRGEEPSKARL